MLQAQPEAGHAVRFPIDALTAHERTVLELLALGLSNRQIGERLWITRKGVGYHIGNLLAKFQVQTRTGLVARAYATGILESGTWPPRLCEPPSDDVGVVGPPSWAARR
jgi:DNA-binding CsgD family transcriptional regulator